MKFSVFHPFPTYDLPRHGSWPAPPRVSRQPGVSSTSLRGAIDFAHAVEAAGLDQISVAEHHYSSAQLSPNSVTAAVLLAREVGIDIGLLGSTLPLVNPVRLAEEIGMLSALAPGRLLVGFFRGTPNELLTYGTNPWESKEVFYEQMELMKAIWSEPEPFAWIGRHFEYRTVAVWPQPEADLPILVSANSPDSATYAARNGYIAGFSFAPAPVIATFAEVFKAEAQKAGRTVAGEDMLYRAFALVAETDAEAERIADETGFGNLMKLFAAPAPLMARLAMGMAGVPASVPLPTEPKGMSMPVRPNFMGGPEKVAREIADFILLTGIERIEVTLTDAALPTEVSLRSLELYGREVLPRVRALVGERVAA
ncbi:MULTISPECIES: LLM class flavin-dependent oxidoreductase [Microbacterium]|uniref:LLM class flavin-dependent oxidoreductase n=1 Tax=Microbacterium TaxID=33882 RepID=UPI0007686CC9|nr:MULTISPECIES: LLM class flavin-dependent oxidoreductase [Microbacterium]KXC06264.1 hypothetical protein MhomT_06540 [Microbacterium hominis]QOC25032.1 LLM class flavin-dependent oxidoreductase [Microbacterium hominis]QOC29078.1 LLM class flavin-dependent oxidoreductase [Microbacterium hominis]QYF98707.1 LLM class flavin-dependent oxidoreductase [Microbacterium sp. PAMC21962]